MRLEKHQQSLIAAAASGCERGADFGRMMTVVVDQSNAREIAAHFEAAPYSGEFRKSRANEVGGNIERKSDSGCSRGIAHVVNARRRRKMKYAEVVAAICKAEVAREAIELHI